jgi:hypothetical protein
MRGILRWLTVLAVVAIVILVCVFSAHRFLIPAALVIQACWIAKAKATCRGFLFRWAEAQRFHRNTEILRG